MTNATKAKQRRRAEAARANAGRRSTGLWIGLGVLAAVVVAAAVAFGGGQESATPPTGTVSIARASGPMLAVGEAVPDWSAPSLSGDGELAWAGAVGQPTVLAVWAPWCPHCQAELPRLDAALASHPDVEMVSVATAIGAQPGPTPQEYLDSEGLDFAVGVDDEANTIMTGLGVSSFPTTYYVASDGTVLDVTTGEVDPARLDQILATLESS